jgi:hypothetical protein
MRRFRMVRSWPEPGGTGWFGKAGYFFGGMSASRCRRRCRARGQSVVVMGCVKLPFY